MLVSAAAASLLPKLGCSSSVPFFFPGQTVMGRNKMEQATLRAIRWRLGAKD